MNGINFRISNTENKLAVGSSKLFGNPDVWDAFEWPYIEENGEKYDLTFMCQINCTQAAAFDEDGILPKTGMLYFFYDLDTMPEAPTDRSARVLWYNGELSYLHEMILTDENGNSLAFFEQEIDFGVTDTSEKSSHLLLGNMTQSNDCVSGCIALLQLCSFETEDAEIRFKDGGMLCFYIEQNQLTAHDFSDVKAAQVICE